MAKPLTAHQLRQLEPRYTIGGLFQSGMLGAGEETALEEIKALRDGFNRYVNPGRGWMTPRFSDSRPDMPRQLGNGPAWRRYKAWRARWSRQIVAPSPGVPWGLSVADVAIKLVMEPVTFNELAPLTGMSAIALVELFVASVRDYGNVVTHAKQRFWSEWGELDARIKAEKAKKQRENTRLRVTRYRRRQRGMPIV